MLLSVWHSTVYRYATEVVSMGVEYLYADPAKFARDDPEHFRFIVNLLRGIFEE
jgi:hypothetical protein